MLIEWAHALRKEGDMEKLEGTLGAAITSDKGGGDENSCNWRAILNSIGNWISICIRMGRWAKAGALERLVAELICRHFLAHG